MACVGVWNSLKQVFPEPLNPVVFWFSIFSILVISGSSICAEVSRSLPSFMAFIGLSSLFFGGEYF